MAKSSKPKEIVVVGSKVKETANPPAGLEINVDDQLLGTLSWDVGLAASSSNPPSGFAFTIVDDFQPPAALEIGSATLHEDPLGIVVGINDNIPEVGDEVLVSFIAGDALGNRYEVDLLLRDASGDAVDAAGLTTPLQLQLADFTTATLSLSEVGVRAPFAVAEVDSLESFVVPEPASAALIVSMLGTFVVGWLFRK